MNLMYLTALDILNREKCGILGKIKGQIDSFERNDFNVHFFHFSGINQGIIENDESEIKFQVKGKNTRSRLSNAYDVLLDYILKNKIKIVYIRFTSLDKNSIKFYKRLKDHDIMLIIEFYSHNLELEAKKTVKRLITENKYFNAIKGEISLLINKYYFNKLHYYVDLIVTTTKIGKLYDVPTINVINGINTNSVNVRQKKENEYDFNIISVAMISSWHGYDRVIKGIYNYYRNNGKLNIMYNVIGEGEEKSKLIQLVKKYKLENHVKFPGILLGNELEPYYDTADVALEMLAGFRRTNGQISSIKMAEYFAKGIPVIYSSSTNTYNAEMSKYCYNVPYDDSDISIEHLIEFNNNLTQHEKNVSERMHEIAKNQFDWTITMKELINYMNNCN